MTKKTLEKHLTHIFESDLTEFLSLSIKDRLEKAKEFTRWENNELYSVFKKYSEFIEEDIKEKTKQEKEEYFNIIDGHLRSYLNREYQYIFHHLPYFFWFSHLIFDGTYSQLTYEAKQELRNLSNLNTPKKRKDAYVNFFGRFVDEKVKDGGSKSNWDKWTRLYFLSLYERFSVVIENARKDIKKLRQNKTPAMEIKKKILEKYRIPTNAWSDVVNSKRIKKSKLSRKWSTKKMKKDFGKYTSKMGFSDSYLTKVLRLARRDAAKHLHCCKDYSNHKLIFLKWGDSNFIQHNYRYKKETLLELKYDSYVQENNLGMELYFV